MKLTRREKSHLIIALGELINLRLLESERFINAPNKELDALDISEKKSYRKELRELSTLQKKIYALDYLDFKNSRRSKWVD